MRNTNRVGVAMTDEGQSAQQRVTHLRESVRRILDGGPVTAVDVLTPENGPLDMGESAVLVRGDILAGTVLRCGRSVIVEGGIAGRTGQTCRIRAGGEVIVMGDVRDSRIRAEKVRVVGEASRCRLTVDADIEVGGNMTDVDAIVGDAEAWRDVVEVQRQRIAAEESQREAIEYELRAEQRRLRILFQATGVRLDVGVGEVFRLSPGRLEVNLLPFYAAMSGRTENEIDRALTEFYAKAVVGLLSRVNRRFIAGGPNNRRAFVTVVRRLHDLFTLTRRLDKQGSRITEATKGMETLLNSIEQARRAVRVQAAARPDTHLTFIVPRWAGKDEGLSSQTETAELNVRTGPGLERCEVARTDVDGSEATDIVDSGDLTGVVFGFERGRVVWKPLAAI
jgi:hypothetical protein